MISQDETPVFCAGVLDSLTVELRGTKDFSKLNAGIAILGYIASISDPISIKAFSHLLTFLAHRYPKVCITKMSTLLINDSILMANGILLLLPDPKICC